MYGNSLVYRRKPVPVTSIFRFELVFQIPKNHNMTLTIWNITRKRVMELYLAEGNQAIVFL